MHMHLAAGDHRTPPSGKLDQLHRQLPGGLLAAAPGLQGEETGHVTRRRTGSVVKRPRHLDSPEPERVPLPPAGGAAGLAQTSSVMATMEATAAAEASSVSSTPTQLGRARRVSFSTATAPVVLAPLDSTTPSDPLANPTLPPSPPAFRTGAPSPALESSVDSPAANAPSPADATGNSASPPLTPGAAAAAASLLKGRMPTFPLSDAYKPEPVDGRKHPRDLVPLDIGFPTLEMADKIRKEDQEDRLLMATCAVLHSHENRALCPKEIAEVMFQRDWLHNVGTTPFAHISTCIRSHLRRASTSNPPYAPILTSFELVGALTVAEVAAVGLVASDRPAVKRGALWYLDERVLGKGVGADDPFVRCRREAGLEPSEFNGIYVRGMPPPVLLPLHGFGEEDGDDEGGMGRGKRKRRASSAAIAALSTEVTIGSPASAPSATPAVASPLAIPQPTRPPAPPAALGSRRSQTLSGPSSAPVKSGVPRLRLRLAALEEVDSGMDDSDGFTSDAARRRSKNKKKVRRATSEGTSRAGSAEVDAMSEDDDEREGEQPGSGAFSSASSSALLAQRLLAASTSAPFTPSSLESTQEVVSPDSLNIGTSTTGGLFARAPARQHTLSMSAPNIFAAFPSARSPEVMEVDTNSSSFYGEILPKSDPSDEDDFHEAMLRGEDFDFEWGSESYTTAGEDEAALSLPPFTKSKPKSREMSIGLPEEFDAKDDVDALSTPATTPRSPQEEMEPPSGAVKMGMEATLCGAFAGHVDHPDEVIIKEEEEDDDGRVLDRATSTDSLTSIVDEDSSSPVNSPPATITRAPVDASTLSVPLPSPLALDLPPMLALSHPFAADYDFVGHEDDDRSAYRATQYERDMAESADDEDEEDDDIVTVKIEEEGSVGPEGSTAPSSRASSVYPAIESFSRRLMVTEMSCSSSSSGSSDSDTFDPLVIVSHSLLASGLPVPQPAPSPPDTTDWGMHLDLDEFDGDLNSSGDLLGPEMVGLEELDLAWADDETEEEWHTRSANARGLLGTNASTFLTGSPVDCWTPIASRTASSDALRARVVVSPIASATKGSPLASTMSRSPSAQSASVKTAAVAHPTSPLSIPITATIVERDVAVYATNIVDHDTATSFSLLRRIDVDYVNGTTLLRPTFTSPSERTSTLRDISKTFSVASGGDSIEGTWIPLSSARDLASRFAPSLGHLAPFLEDSLGQSFPSPIPELKLTLHSLFASASSNASDEQQNWGHPLFAGTVDAEKALAPDSVDGGAKAAATAAEAVGKGARAGRSSLDGAGEESAVSSSGGRRRG